MMTEIESLEPRRHLAAAQIELHNSALTVTGTSDDDRIQLIYQPPADGDFFLLNVNGTEYMYRGDEVSTAFIASGDGHDVIDLQVHINCYVFGGNGRDNIVGGGGNDTLTGGADRDSLSGKAGDDLL